ncbi:hypothetical protein HPB50_028701 [Hyalomma asiaticum]|nr:hypothetical protein HPB50_028701 [Hyalomma asiaticum]
MCTGCSYWHTLDATPYESVEEAEAAPDFYCQQCETIRILREEFVLKLKQETEICKLAVANVTAVLEEEISMREREQERIEVLLKEEKSRRELLEQKLAGVACSSGHLDAGVAEIPTELPVETMETTTAQGDTVRGRSDPSAGSMLTSTEESGRKPEGRGNAVLMNETQEARGEPGDTKVTATSKMKHKNTSIEKRESRNLWKGICEQEGRQKIGPGIENERRVFVFGDGDAFRMKRAALRMVGWNQNVQFRTQTNATMGEVAAAVDATPEVWEAAEAMVVIHAGTGVVQHLEHCGCGYTLTHNENGQPVVSHTATLVYADDFAVLAESAEELQELLDICGKEMGRIRLRFSPTKYVVMVWGASHIRPSETWRLQRSEIPLSASTKYLGVRLTTGADYLSAYEKVRAAKYRGLLCRSALWSYNPYEVMRALWKMVAVPGLTYANAVLCLSSGIREFLERREREIGRLALGGAQTHTGGSGPRGDGVVLFHGERGDRQGSV